MVEQSSVSMSLKNSLIDKLEAALEKRVEDKKSLTEEVRRLQDQLEQISFQRQRDVDQDNRKKHF